MKLVNGLTFNEDGTRRFFVTELEERFSEAPGDGPGRRWVQICRDGSWKHPKFGKVDVTPQFREALVRNFEANVRNTEIPVDYSHNTSGPASGWYRKLENRGNALFAQIEFTPTAAASLKAGEYRYFSPEWDPNYTDAETGKAHGPTLIGGGLVIRPFFRGMQALQFSEITEPSAFTGQESGLSSQEFDELLSFTGAGMAVRRQRPISSVRFQELGLSSQEFDELLSFSGAGLAPLEQRQAHRKAVAELCAELEGVKSPETLPNNYTHPELSDIEVDTIRMHTGKEGIDPHEYVKRYLQARKAKGAEFPGRGKV